MSRFLFSIFLLSFLSFRSVAQIDGPFVGERFELYNGLVNYKVWGIGDFLMMNSHAFNLEMHDVNFLKKQNFTNFESDYLFQEESFWVKRLFRTIIFDGHKVNQQMTNVVTEKGNISFVTFLKNNVSNHNLFYYKNGDFNIRLADKGVFDDQLDSICGFQFKEDFAYNRVSSQLEVYISGIAPIVKTSDGYTAVFWLNFKNLKGELSANNCNSVLVNNLLERKFKASVDQTTNIIMKGVIDHSYQNDLDALVNLKLLEEKLAVNSNIYSKEGSFKLTLDHLTIKGVTRKGKLEGAVVLKEKGKGEVLFVEFVDGVPNGKYVSSYSEGKIKHTGDFQDGLRIGEWNGYFKNGKVATTRKYEYGFLNGLQRIYYSNGVLRNEYSFNEGKLSGDFASYFDDGTIKMKGGVANGLMTGEWDCNVQLNSEFVNVIMRNPQYWNSNFKLVPEWDAEQLKDGKISFIADFKYETDERCLNSLCPVLTIKNIVK